jgi:hypothetical protein
MTRRRLLYGAAAAGTSGAGLGYIRFAEPRWFEIAEIDIRLPRWPAGRELRVLHLSDFHLSQPVPAAQLHAALNLALPLRPDIIFLTGDYVTALDHSDPEDLRSMFERISAAAPAYAVLGNHDGGFWARARGWLDSHDRIDRMLQETGIHLLHNRSRWVESRGVTFQLVGVGDLWSREVRPREAFSEVTGHRPVILLAHNPDTKTEVADRPWDLMLSGHTHGGQCVIPLYGAPYAPVTDRRFVSGLHEWERRQIYVTRGLGGIYGLRLNCRPEISLLRLRSASAG